MSDLGVYHVIILAGIISYIDLNYYYFFLTLDFYLSFFNNFSNTKIINNTKLKTEKDRLPIIFGCYAMFSNAHFDVHILNPLLALN